MALASAPGTNPPPRGFERAEFERRLAALQLRMATEHIDLALFNTEPEVRYFSGFLTQFWQSPTRPWFLLVPAAGKPVAVIPGIGQSAMQQTWIEDIRTWPSPNPDDEGISILLSAVLELSGQNARIGILKGAESHQRMPLADFEKLTSLLPNATFADINPMVRGLRAIKSEAEIAKIRHACQCASRAFDRIPELFAGGMTERHIMQAFKVACLEEGVDDVSYLVGGAAAGGYNDIISPPGNRKLEPGDVLILDTGCVWDGYFCDFDRNFAIRTISDAVQEAHARIWEATELALELATPGTRCCELFDAMNVHMGSEGNVGRLGHGLGMQLTEHPSLAAFDQTVLEPGMVLTLEPGYAFAPGKMLVHEENIVVRETGGCELLSHRAPQQMPVING